MLCVTRRLWLRHHHHSAAAPSALFVKHMAPHACDTSMEFVKLLQSSRATPSSRVEGLRLLLRKHSETPGEDTSGRGLAGGASGEASASGMPTLAATISFMCATPAASDADEAGHQLGIECSPSQRLIVALSGASDLQRRLCLQFLDEVNSGASSRSHVHSVAFHLLRQLQLAVAADTTRVMKDAAGRTDEVCPNATLERDLKVLHVELLCLLATLSATGLQHPISSSDDVGENSSSSSSNRSKQLDEEAANSAAMTDACYWVNELCALLRMHSRRDNGSVSFGTARHTLALLLPLLPRASASDKLLFQQTLRNVYASKEEELQKPFGLYKKFHFVTCVCVPFATLHYGVVPLLNATRQTQVSICIGLSLVIAYVVQKCFFPSTPQPQAAPASIEPKMDTSSSKSMLASIAAAATAVPHRENVADTPHPPHDTHLNGKAASPLVVPSSGSPSSLFQQVALEELTADMKGEDMEQRPWWKKVLTLWQ